jgi:hypothetical protein
MALFILGVLRNRYCNYHSPCAVSDSFFDFTLTAGNHLVSIPYGPSAHLTNVELTMDSPSVCIHLLKLGPDLSPLIISMQLIEVIPPVPPFMHTKIRSLCINYYDDAASSSMHSHSLIYAPLRLLIKIALQERWLTSICPLQDDR